MDKTIHEHPDSTSGLRLSEREATALSMMATLRCAPMLTHGAGRYLDNSDRESLINWVVAEFMMAEGEGAESIANRITAGLTAADAAIALRHALWHRMAELIGAECARRDPEFAHARRRIRDLLRFESPTAGLVTFELFRVQFLTTERGAEVRDLPVIPRDVLQRRFAVPPSALKYGDGLLDFIRDILDTLTESVEFRPWLSVDDLAFLIARAEETANRQGWMSESQQLPEALAESNLADLLAKARLETVNWFDQDYAPRKSWPLPVRAAIRAALIDHIHELSTDPQNHPGLQAILLHHLPAAPTEFRKSNLRNDFEYIARRFRSLLADQLSQIRPP